MHVGKLGADQAQVHLRVHVPGPREYRVYLLVQGCHRSPQDRPVFAQGIGTARVLLAHASERGVEGPVGLQISFSLLTARVRMLVIEVLDALKVRALGGGVVDRAGSGQKDSHVAALHLAAIGADHRELSLSAR